MSGLSECRGIFALSAIIKVKELGFWPNSFFLWRGCHFARGLLGRYRSEGVACGRSGLAGVLSREALLEPFAVVAIAFLALRLLHACVPLP